jgi:ketosteroid isomerase-like protein
MTPKVGVVGHVEAVEFVVRRSARAGATMTAPDRRSAPMPASDDRAGTVRACFAAFQAGDRRHLEDTLADDFTFFSPADVGIDKARFFERCWPNSEMIRSFDLTRLQEIGDDEVLVTYEAERNDGSRFRNTEVYRLRDGRITSQEVYFGWNL